ncbi:hypothetical protein [Bdellovibrio sp. HCB209]|uniref:hypothetical protein n=1 Tax=Bdellovibrio sp. HCB209 TaxID=3394354 RepID=UPI0039B45B73
MKTKLVTNIFVVTLTLFFSNYSPAASPVADIFTPGSTSDYTEQFIDFGKIAAKKIRSVANFPVTDEQMLQAVLSTRIEFTNDQLFSPEGIQVDALNYPGQGLIRINIDSWFRYRWSEENRMQLVIHEYLGILRVDDSKYAWTQYLMNGGALKGYIACEYSVAGKPYYLRYDNYGSKALKTYDYSFVFYSGEGFATAPVTRTPATITSLNFKWSDLITGNWQNFVNWAIGISWYHEDIALHGRATLTHMSQAGKFLMDVYEVNVFNSSGVMTPRHFMTLTCENIEVSETP